MHVVKKVFHLLRERERDLHLLYITYRTHLALGGRSLSAYTHTYHTPYYPSLPHPTLDFMTGPTPIQVLAYNSSIPSLGWGLQQQLNNSGYHPTQSYLIQPHPTLDFSTILPYPTRFYIRSSCHPTLSYTILHHPTCQTTILPSPTSSNPILH